MENFFHCENNRRLRFKRNDCSLLFLSLEAATTTADKLVRCSLQFQVETSRRTWLEGRLQGKRIKAVFAIGIRLTFIFSKKGHGNWQGKSWLVEGKMSWENRILSVKVLRKAGGGRKASTSYTQPSSFRWREGRIDASKRSNCDSGKTKGSKRFALRRLLPSFDVLQEKLMWNVIAKLRTHLKHEKEIKSV